MPAGPDFLHHRELLGGLCRAGWQVVRELIATAAGDAEVRPGMEAVIQTSGDLLGWHPHVHAIASSGGWDEAGCWVPMPFVDPVAAERLFRHLVITQLRDEGLLSQERIDLLLSWRHTGFSAHNGVTVAPGDPAGIERLARYLLRAPVALERLSVDPAGVELHYRRKGSGRLGGSVEVFAPEELLARLLMHVPAPRQHQTRFYGHYSNAARGRRVKAAAAGEDAGLVPVAVAAAAVEPGAAERRRLRRQWAQMLRRVYEVDPLECHECGGRMKILAFVLEAGAVRRILAHLALTGRSPARDPPTVARCGAAAAS